MRFSQDQFLTKKNVVSPLFLQSDSTDRAQNFLLENSWHRKKHGFRLGPSSEKIISARKNEVSIFARGGKILVIFGLCDPHIC